jgi:putative nucleotidyltransferase with HDIG domain
MPTTESGTVAFDPTVEEQLLLASTLEQSGWQMAARERFAEASVAAAFIGIAAGLLWRLPPHGGSIGLWVACVLLMAVASAVRFDTPFGFTVATQVAFVPALFVLPLSLVPVAVVVALAIAHARQVITGRFSPDRLWLVIGNAWFAIGPVMVFAISGTHPRNAGALLLIAAFAAQIAVDTVICAIRLWGAGERAISTQLWQGWIYAVDAALGVIGLLVASDLHEKPVAILAILPLLFLLRMFASERHDKLKGLVALNNAYRGTALVLADVVEADDTYTGQHSKSVVTLALAVGEEMGLDLEQCRNLEFGALLHDVGKIAIPKEIINKQGPLDPDEWTVIKTHTIEGQRMLDQAGGFMREVGLIVRSHHERWDGGGYPDQLAGEEIPIQARIIACCDTWNAMRTDRSYRKALPHEVALAELLKNSGTQLDPAAVQALLKVIASDA